MRLKRIYKRDEFGVLVQNDSGEYVIDHTKVIRSSERQNFSTRLVERAVTEGWMSIGRGKIVTHTRPELSYKIVREPGYYCCHCNKKLDDGPSARTHIEAAHAGKNSPDPGNPSGYRRDNF
ncbi:MAG: hypothetical protein ACE5H7_14015, partial [Acidiferrobacterales bacterium]